MPPIIEVRRTNVYRVIRNLEDSIYWKPCRLLTNLPGQIEIAYFAVKLEGVEVRVKHTEGTTKNLSRKNVKISERQIANVTTE